MLDVIMTSSCRKSITATLESFLDKMKYSDKFRLLVHIDVLDSAKLPYINKFLRTLEKTGKIKLELITNTAPDKNWYRAHTKAVNYLFSQIRTPFYFHLEDDWKFLREIDLEQLTGLMENNRYIDHIRFSKEVIKEKAWLYSISDQISEECLVPNYNVTIEGISLVKTPLWSFNPHLGRTSIIKNFTNIPPDNNPEKYICNRYPDLVKENHIYIFGKIGDSAYVKDMGRNILRQKVRKMKYILTGGKYASYRFGP